MDEAAHERGRQGLLHQLDVLRAGGIELRVELHDPPSRSWACSFVMPSYTRHTPSTDVFLSHRPLRSCSYASYRGQNFSLSAGEAHVPR